MMTLEEVRAHFETMTGAALDGSMPENMEDIITAFRNDYEEYYTQKQPDSDDAVYKQKYEDLREKYIKRFSGIEIQDDFMAQPPEQTAPKEDIANITVAELFERRN